MTGVFLWIKDSDPVFFPDQHFRLTQKDRIQIRNTEPFSTNTSSFYCVGSCIGNVYSTPRSFIKSLH